MVVTLLARAATSSASRSPTTARRGAAAAASRRPRPRKTTSSSSCSSRNTHDYILCFSNRGRLYWLKVYEVPQGSRIARGKPIVNMFPLEEGEKINAVLPVKEFDERPLRVHGDRAGHGQEDRARRVLAPAPSGIIAVDLDEGDYLIGAALTDGKHDVMLFSDGGKAVRFDEDDVRADGPPGHAACAACALDDGQRVIAHAGGRGRDRRVVLTATENGYGKRTPIAEYTRHGRGTQGMIAIQTSRAQRQGGRRDAGRRDDEIMLITDRRRADPHRGGADPRDGPRHPGRDADRARRRREARRPGAHRGARPGQRQSATATAARRPTARTATRPAGSSRRRRRRTSRRRSPTSPLDVPYLQLQRRARRCCRPKCWRAPATRCSTGTAAACR